MRIRSRLLPLLIVAVLILPLGACGGGGSGQTKSQTAGQSTTPAATTQASAARPAGQSSPGGASVTATPASSPTSSPALPSRAASPETTPSSTPDSPANSSGTSASWPVFGGSPSHQGVAPGSAKLSNPHSAWKSPELDGEVYAQPLIVDNLVYVATENNTIYALKASSGAIAWQKNFGAPVPLSSLPCGDIDPTGITSTPVIDTVSGTLYTVAFLNPGHHELYAINIKSGAIKFKRAIDPPGANPLTQQQRSGLVIGKDYVYVAYGGLYGDCGRYHGWVVGSRLDGSQPLISYQVPTSNLGAIWAPPGPTVAADGNLYVSTGNGASQSMFDYGDAVVRLTPQLKVRDWFAPSNWQELDAKDLDLASTAPALLNNGLIFQTGKSGVGYLLKESNLGHIGGQVFQAQVCGGGYGGSAYSAPWLYVSCSNGLTALKIGPGDKFTVEWRQVGGMVGTPVIAGGAVWTLGTSTATLYALAPSSGKVLFQQSVGEVMHFASPSALGGFVYAPAGRHVVAVAMR